MTDRTEAIAAMIDEADNNAAEVARLKVKVQADAETIRQLELVKAAWLNMIRLENGCQRISFEKPCRRTLADSAGLEGKCACAMELDALVASYKADREKHR